MNDEISDERLEAEARLLEDPLSYTEHNDAQIRFIEAVRIGKDSGVDVVIAVMGNGTGKSFGLISIFSAIVFGTSSPLFDRAPFGPDLWPYVKNLRLVTTTASLDDHGPIQQAIRQLFPEGRYGHSRGVGKGYNSQGWSDTGFVWDFMSYKQDVTEFSAHTKGAIFFSEPPPKRIFTENATRLRAGGLIIIEMTPLTYAAWVKEDLIDPGALKVDGKKVGNVTVVYGEIEDNCKDHSPGGQLSHQAIQAQIALWPEEEREARRKGLFMRLAGLIHPKWGAANELLELPDFHQECWDRGKYKLCYRLDPHDRKPFAMSWAAIFPNQDVITIAEWPDFEFHRATSSPIEDIEDYRDLILATEADLGRRADYRLIDPLFGNSPKSGEGLTVKQMLQKSCRRCIEAKKPDDCTHRLVFNKDIVSRIAEGHLLVRRAIGDPDKGIRPKLYALKESCTNTCYGYRHYGYKEEKDPDKALSEKPELVHKDFPDLDRFLALSGLIREDPTYKPQNFWRPKKRGRRVSAT